MSLVDKINALAQRVGEEFKTRVKTINGITPDKDGNVSITVTDEEAVKLQNSIQDALTELIQEEGGDTTVNPVISTSASSVKNNLEAALQELINEEQ